MRESETRLRDLLRRWTAIVEQCASRKNWKRGVSAREYYELHTSLLSVCRELVKHADSDQNRLQYKELSRLVEPWVSFESLKNSHPQLLKGLLSECDAVSDALEHRLWRFGSRRRVIGVAMLLAAVVMGGALLLLTPSESGDMRMPGVVDEAQALIKQFTLRIRWSSFLERFYVITVIVVAFAIFLGTRTIRRWS